MATPIEIVEQAIAKSFNVEGVDIINALEQFGYVIVPVEATYPMLRAGARKPVIPEEDLLRPGTSDCDVNPMANYPGEGRPNAFMTGLRYKAMLEARPR